MPIWSYFKKKLKRKGKIIEKTKYGLDIDTHKITLNQWFEKWMELYIEIGIKTTIQELYRFV